jgi:hypothetical protein
MSLCFCGAERDNARAERYREEREKHRLDDPYRHKNILERLQWIYRMEVKGKEPPRFGLLDVCVYVPTRYPVGYAPPPTAFPEPIRHDTYRFHREDVEYPTHRSVRWTCQGLTIAEEIEFNELHDMGR